MSQSLKALKSKRDYLLIFVVLALVSMGLLMVYSASIVTSTRQYGQPLHYLIHQVLYLFIGLVGGYLIYTRLSLDKLAQLAPICLFFALITLVLVLIPGLGRQINGSSRWLGLGPVGIQVSELAKLLIIIYMASYIERHGDTVRYTLMGFIKPMFILGLVAILLLLEPDFGSTVVLGLTVLSMFFLAGVQWRIFWVAGIGVCSAFVLLAVSSPYRFARLTTFAHPWAHPFGSGYQLTQSLIAFGRGGVWGVGLGNSIQKWFYLPEAHTDFLFAVLAEELGLVGIMTILLLFGVLVYRGLKIGRKAFDAKQYFSTYLAYGLSLWVGFQAFINMGVNAGLLPTKGLTLPLMSYGGSSLSVMCLVIALLLKIDVTLRKS